MQRKCDACGQTTKVRSFRYWDGTCEHCRAPISRIQKRYRPPATREEIADYLAHMDDLNSIYHEQQSGIRLSPLAIVFSLVCLVGVCIDRIDLVYGGIMWFVMMSVLSLYANRFYHKRCPRCDMRFFVRSKFGLHFKVSSANACVNCGLRILTQGDLALARTNIKASKTDGPEDD